MRTLTLCLLLAVTVSFLAQAQQDTSVLDQQKKAAHAAWTAMDVGDPSHTETKHLLVFAPKTFEKRLGTIGSLLEKYHDQAFKALALDPKEAYPGKITVYLFDRNEHLPNFARRIEKRRPMGGEVGSFSAEDDKLHAVAVPGEGKQAIPVEARAGEMIAALLQQRKAGVRTSLPEWLTVGFGRATSYRVLPAREKFISEDRKMLRALVKKCNASDVWGTSLEAGEAIPMQGSVVEFIGYNLGSARFARFLEGFKPGEDVQTKTTAQALEAAGLEMDKINSGWKKWVK